MPTFETDGCCSCEASEALFLAFPFLCVVVLVVQDAAAFSFFSSIAHLRFSSPSPSSQHFQRRLTGATHNYSHPPLHPLPAATLYVHKLRVFSPSFSPCVVGGAFPEKVQRAGSHRKRGLNLINIFEPCPPPSIIEFKVGCFSFGGGTSTILDAPTTPYTTAATSL